MYISYMKKSSVNIFHLNMSPGHPYTMSLKFPPNNVKRIGYLNTTNVSLSEDIKMRLLFISLNCSFGEYIHYIARTNDTTNSSMVNFISEYE